MAPAASPDQVDISQAGLGLLRACRRGDSMNTIAPFSHDQVHDFAIRWFDGLDRHAPVDEMKPFIAVDALQVVVPEGTFHGLDGFRQWYGRVLHLFFDGKHTLKALTLSDVDDGAQTVQVVVSYKCRTWTPPNAKSQELDFDSHESWLLRPSAAGQPEILRYAVDRVQYNPGSAKL